MIMITKKKFEAYKTVQKSNITNMLDIPVVCKLSGLASEEVIDIINNYNKYLKEYGGI